MQFATELECVFTDSVGNVVDKLSDRIRALELWPLETAQSGDESSGEADARQSSGEGPADAGVETVARAGVLRSPGSVGW